MYYITAKDTQLENEELLLSRGLTAVPFFEQIWRKIFGLFVSAMTFFVINIRFCSSFQWLVFRKKEIISAVYVKTVWEQKLR
jgi:hypothetical protein